MNGPAVLSSLAKAVQFAVESRWVDMARSALDAVLAAVDEPTARQLLDDVAIRRANAIANIAEDAKFGVLPDLADLAHPKLDEDPWRDPPVLVDDGKDDPT